jgi:hypothetical protein
MYTTPERLAGSYARSYPRLSLSLNKNKKSCNKNSQNLNVLNPTPPTLKSSAKIKNKWEFYFFNPVSYQKSQ